MTDLAAFPVSVSIPVAWGDMDAFQHVNNIVYLRWFETARIAYFQRVGVLASLEASGVGPILRSTDCRFRRAVTFPDTVLAEARVTEVGEDRFTMAHRVRSEAMGGQVAAEGGGIIVTFDYREQRKTPIPKAIRDAILALEGDPLRG